jgi:hypothetical protein
MRYLVALVSVLALIGVWVPPTVADDIDRLSREATSGSLQVRLRALQALGHSGDLRALQPLLMALHDDDTTIRACAIAALQSLVRALKGLYDTVAQWIEALLATLQSPAREPPPTVERTHQVRWI